MLELNLTAVPHVQVYGQIPAVAFFPQANSTVPRLAQTGRGT